jgi:hypothetical protein
MATTTNSRPRNRGGGLFKVALFQRAAHRTSPGVDNRRLASTATMPHEGELNVQFSRSRPVVEKGTGSSGRRTSWNRRCACGFWKDIWKGSTHQKTVRISSGADRGCPKKSLGKGSGKGEGCSDTWQTHALGSRTKEDRRCAKGEMGKSEGGEEKGLGTSGSRHRCRWGQRN